MAGEVNGWDPKAEQWFATPVDDNDKCSLCGCFDPDGYSRIGCSCSEIEKACSDCQMKYHYKAAKLDSREALVYISAYTWRNGPAHNAPEALCRGFSIDLATAYAKLAQMEDMEDLLEHGTSVRWCWATEKGKELLTTPALSAILASRDQT